MHRVIPPEPVARKWGRRAGSFETKPRAAFAPDSWLETASTRIQLFRLNATFERRTGSAKASAPSRAGALMPCLQLRWRWPAAGKGGLISSRPAPRPSAIVVARQTPTGSRVVGCKMFCIRFFRSDMYGRGSEGERRQTADLQLLRRCCEGLSSWGPKTKGESTAPSALGRTHTPATTAARRPPRGAGRSAPRAQG